MNSENKNYQICWLQICPFDKKSINKDLNSNEKIKIYKPDRDNYPYRLCVLDKAKKIAVDVLFEQKYDYIETSSLYFLGNEASKIEDTKRYACLKLPIYLMNCKTDDFSRAMNIMAKLKQDKEYPDGNLISNENYLSLLDDNPKVKIKK